MSNIQYDQIQEHADGLAHEVNDEGVNVSIDPDDAKRIDTGYANRDEPNIHHHERSNSFKKPATFKAVSVTKSFLAKAGAPTIPGIKSSDDKGERPPKWRIITVLIDL